MSSKVIQNFVNVYSHTIVDFCKHSGITHLPYPKKPINTDKCIYKYHKYLEKYINDTIIHKHEYYYSQKQSPKTVLPVDSEYSSIKIKKKFPKHYFNYESF
jgi:hypothetical protein